MAIIVKTQEQKWHDFTRLVFVAEEDRGIVGSVQVELYPEPQDEYGTTAFIYGLWVEESHRRKGIARFLMDSAEERIRWKGHKVVALKWQLADTPREIFAWYKRRGYDEKAFDGLATWALMFKNLVEKKGEEQ